MAKMNWTIVGIIFFFFMFSLFTFDRMEKLNHKSTEMESNWLPSIIAINAINTATSDYRIAEALHVLSTDHSKMEQQERRMKRLRQQIAHWQTQYQPLISSEKERSTYHNFVQEYEEYLNISKEAIAFSRDNENDHAMVKIENSGILFNAFSGNLTQLVELNSEGGIQASRGGDQIFVESKIILFGINAFVVVAGLILILLMKGWMSRTVKFEPIQSTEKPTKTNFFNTLTVKTKLRFAFLGLAILFVIFAGLSLHRMQVINDKSTEIEINWLPSVALVNAINTATSDLRIAEAVHILSTDTIEMTQREKDINKLKQEIDKQRKLYESLISSEEEEIIYKDFSRKYNEYLAAGEKAMTHSRKNENELATQQLKNSGVIFNDMSAELVQLVELNNRGGQSASREGDRLYSISTAILTSTTVLVFMLALFALVIFEKLTSQPLTQLSVLIQKLAAGDISISPIFQNRYDEVGYIAQAVAAIAKTLTALVQDSTNLISAVQAGTLSIQVDSSRHPGEFGTVVAGMNQLVSGLSKPLVEVAEVMQRLALGDLKGRMQDTYEGDLQTLKNNVNNSLNVSSQSLVEVTEVMQGVALGNLEGRMQGAYEGELKELKINVNKSLDTLTGLLSELSQTITYMTTSNWEAIKAITHIAQDSANDPAASVKYQGEFIQIKNTLETAAIRLAETATKNEIQDWFKSGQAQLNDLTGGDQEIAVLTKKIITFLTTYVQAQVGIFYLLRDIQPEPPYLQMIASYAYTTHHDRPTQFLLTEGLVGQSALECKTLSVTQTSEECLPIIRSGLSSVLSHHVLLIPCLYENMVKGVIEIGTDNNPLTDTQREFLEQVMPSIGITVNTAESRTQMQALLQQTQHQADQLQQQQEELQYSNEELRRQQGQLEAQTAELEERTEELERQKTEMEQKNLALEQTQQTLTTKAKELEQAIQYKSEFLANTSHELRTPLNGIIGLAESLIDGVAGELSEKAKANLAMIVGSGKRLATLVNDILDFSKLQHQNLELQLKPIGLREITEIVLTLSQPLVLNKPIRLINAIAAELPPARADENRLQQILYNLIGNAIKFTDRGTVEISAKVVDQHLELVVSDTGIGIPKEKLERIFESFEQGEGSTAREYGGTGLGLAVTKQLVRLHQGQIWVKSKVGQGSQFFLTLPIAEGQSHQLSTARLSLSKVQGLIPIEGQAPAPVEETIAGEQLKILIVDDEPVNLQVLNNYLSLQNYHIVQANSGSQALAFIEEGFKPDAVLLDVMMPKMTGYEVTQTLREKWPADEMPILLLTAKNQVADLVTGLESGANDYLTKPISKDELLARLKTHLQLKELKEEALQLALENERMKTELEITRRLQQMILPKEQELDDLPNLEIAGFMEAADEVGGDYYDVLQRHGHILIGIGDVTGHGLESGMLMLMAQAGIRTLWEHGEPEVVTFLNSINGMIYKNAQERMEVDKNLTLSLLEYQPQNEGGVLRISGRHEDILVVRQGQLERVDTGELGFQVGFVEDIAELVNQMEVPLNVGDVVVLYTDGITEAENLDRQEYSMKRLCEVVTQNWQQPVKEIRQAVIEDVQQHIGEQKVFDDITLVVLKQK